MSTATAKTARYILESLRTNGPTPTRYYDTPEGIEAIERLVKTGRARIVTMSKGAGRLLHVAGSGEPCIEAVPTTAGAQIATTTKLAPVVTMGTLVSVTIGSDQYEAKVVRVTDSTVTVTFGRSSRQELTFRPYVSKSARHITDAGWEPVRGWRASGSYYLVIGESKTELDPSF